ncbi:hypothetical protein [Gloeobacter violaceus]|uniref:Gll0974 protein n=1 Tax=Gloeobacter violaceus (strain ATCC 29082 / PCC 7421) TaxID=251221 RepID=Q7NLZ5_GLOVI|nr:hypothetical protein [Gloeobacter violaceus]BAC88915.1 gll0974 [Gloeobacter violaceus PCC 7421]
MLLQLRVLKNDEFAEEEIFRFQGNIIRVSWDSDGRLVAGRTHRPLLVFYQHENGCRVRCVPAETIKLNGLPLDREQRLALGDQLERADGLTAVVSNLSLPDENQPGVFLFANNPGVQGWPWTRYLAVAAFAGLGLAAILAGTLGIAWSLPDARLQLSRNLDGTAPVSSPTGDGNVRGVALGLKETLWQVSESRAVSPDELLAELASARRIAQQLSRLHSDDKLAVTVAAAVNSFYQLSAGIVASDPEFYQAAVESARRCLGVANANPSEELVVFYRSLAQISLREAQRRLQTASR